MRANDNRMISCSPPESTKLRPGTATCYFLFYARGFTLVELLAVTAILGVLALMAIPAYSSYIKLVKVSRCMSDIRTLEQEINAFILDNNTLPNSLNNIQRADLLDPWDNIYVYRPVATAGPLQRIGHFAVPLNTDFDLFSNGPDGLSSPDIADPESQDDIVRATDGGYVGTGVEF